MKLAFLADGRSAIAVNWIRWFTEHNIEVHWISSRRAEPPLPGLASFQVLSIFPELPVGLTPPRKSRLLHPVATFLRHWLIPFRLRGKARQLDAILESIQPDLLHAMRIPQEGMTAALASRRLASGRTVPLLASVWGDDFTYHARRSPMMGSLTRQTVSRVDALHADCHRDIRLAADWGLAASAKTLVTPGNGGIRTHLFFQKPAGRSVRQKWNLPENAFFILNPRGIRGVARTDTFFLAIPEILKSMPQAYFLGLRMEGMETAIYWVRTLGLEQCVTLLPALSQEDLADIYRLAEVTLSLTEHDGVPNVLLESMACGSFPICGDLESIREWIDDGRNGFLVDPANPMAVAKAVVRVGTDPAFRREAAERNHRLIGERGEWNLVMRQVDDFYRELIGEAKNALT